MENLSASGLIQSLVKNQLLSSVVKIRKIHPNDFDAVSTLLLQGVSLHGGSFWSGAETRSEWLARIYGKVPNGFCEEIRVATVNGKIIGACALVGVVSSSNDTWHDVPAALRFFTIDLNSYSENLVFLLLDEATRICQQWGQARLSAELFSEAHPLNSVLEEFGFHRVFGEKAEDVLLFIGARTYELTIPSPSQKLSLAQ